MKVPQLTPVRAHILFLPPLERMRRERRLALLFFTGFMLLAALFHLLAPDHSTTKESAAPYAVTEEQLP